MTAPDHAAVQSAKVAYQRALDDNWLRNWARRITTNPPPPEVVERVLAEVAALRAVADAATDAWDAWVDGLPGQLEDEMQGLRAVLDALPPADDPVVYRQHPDTGMVQRVHPDGTHHTPSIDPRCAGPAGPAPPAASSPGQRRGGVMDDGTMLRPGRHLCSPPHAEWGAIWRCHCGRRWVCVVNYDEAPDGRHWRRARWPARLSRRSAR